MAIAVSTLTQGSSTSNAATYTTASISPTAGRLLLAFATTTGIAAAVATTITGVSGTWNNLTGSNRPAGLVNYDLAAFTCTNYSGSGTLTVGNTDSATSAAWFIFEITGANLTTPTVAAALKEVDLGLVSTGTVTLDSPAQPENRAFVAFTNANNTAGQADPRANWTELGSGEQVISTPGIVLECQWRSDTYETTASVTYTGGPYQSGAVAVEVNADTTPVFMPAPPRVVQDSALTRAHYW